MNTFRDDRSEGAKAWINRREIHERWEDQYRNSENDLWYARRFNAHDSTLGPAARVGGTGRWMRRRRELGSLAERGFQVTGIDYSEAILPDATANIARHGLSDRIEVRRGDILNLDLPDGVFDLVLCWGVPMHIPDATRAVAPTGPGGATRGMAGLRGGEHAAFARATAAASLLAMAEEVGVSLSRTPAGSEQSCEFAGERDAFLASRGFAVASEL